MGSDEAGRRRQVASTVNGLSKEGAPQPAPPKLLTLPTVLTIGCVAAVPLLISRMNQLVYPQTWVFTLVVIACIVTQMNYLNKAHDTFNTAVVSPIYYTMFTSLTILASVIMFKNGRMSLIKLESHDFQVPVYTCFVTGSWSNTVAIEPPARIRSPLQICDKSIHASPPKHIGSHSDEAISHEKARNVWIGRRQNSKVFDLTVVVPSDYVEYALACLEQLANSGDHSAGSYKLAINYWELLLYIEKIC